MKKDFAELNDDKLENVTGGGFGYYIVRPGDTLPGIAALLGVSQSKLVALNDIKNPDLIYAGQNLKYPC